MVRCACSLYSATVFAGILGIIQSLGYLGLACAVCAMHFASQHNYGLSNAIQAIDTELIYKYITIISISTAAVGMVIATLFLNLLWLTSSIALLVSNKRTKLNANGILQWVIITAVMTGCEMAFTLNFLLTVWDRSQVYTHYGFDLFCLSRGCGIVFGWSFNIPLTVFVHKRYREVKNLKAVTDYTPVVLTAGLLPLTSNMSS